MVTLLYRARCRRASYSANGFYITKVGQDVMKNNAKIRVWIDQKKYYLQYAQAARELANKRVEGICAFADKKNFCEAGGTRHVGRENDCRMSAC